MNNIKKRKIGFDLDDVLLNFSDALREHFNLKLNRNIQRKDIVTFNIEHSYGISKQEARELIDNFFFHVDHHKALPVDGAIKSIKLLSENFDLFIVTAKPESLRDHTEKWIEKYFNDIFKDIHFANHFDPKFAKRNKSEICKELGIEIFIDDSIDNALDIAGSGVPVLLFDAPWNQTDALPENVTRVYSWEEIVEKLKNL